MPLATSQGFGVAYERTGSGPPLLLLSGQSLGPGTWAGVRDDLAAHATVLLVHTRGTGDSRGPVTDGCSTELFARDALAVLDHAGVGRAAVYGFSMGGRVAQVLAARSPDRVRRLVLGATGPGGAHEVSRADAVTQVLRRSSTDAGRRALADLFFSPAFSAAHPALAAEFAPSAEGRWQRQHHAASTAHDGWDLLPLITAPTLVLHGADDAMTPPGNADVLAARLPGARVHLVAGGRHGYLQEFRAEAGAVVAGFLRG
ncbi:alpha/beta fold hydrolase [Kineococcus rubinsiae]|uniref:alpha/beta fold hydrolase n=1 Tax=Kineococcus rubinsiae TaxID=2609562 RepID=UPI00142FCBA6|nr:alpha/beta fold hydrolase [Kineococcus rubinsiae]NIZ90453.1 alpha/beta fold hydrolase [Kineococcus rubinsiae]